MGFSKGEQLGPYQIEALLGAGGMGEVYRARDTRLEREVAIKVLPRNLSANAEFKQRFEREAKSISQLTHAHVCTLYDVGHHEGTHYLVMELLEGDTLAQRLTRGPLPLEGVLRHGAEIASALAAAHRKGVIHRDLKPGNVMLTKSGAKLLDFGLAKTESVLASDPGAATVSQPLTSRGTILGTFQYMAPEQLEGNPVDTRTDIFALGAVLYEMVTGKRAFEGASRASLIASIMSSQPRPISELQPMTPASLDRLIRKCLAKDPDVRWQSADDVADELRWIGEGGSQVGMAKVSTSNRRREILAWTTAAGALVFGIAMATLYISRPESRQHVIHASIPAPMGTTLVSMSEGPSQAAPVSISPDGTRLTFGARDADGREQLWIRSLDSVSARPLPGTENAIYPFWSPDSSAIGFFAEDKLKRVTLTGGPPMIICDAPSGRGGTWNTQGVIVFAPSLGGPLHQVSATGTRSTPVTVLDESVNEDTHRWPFFLPDGRQFLYLARSSGESAGDQQVSIMLGSLDATVNRRLMTSSSNAVYANGYLLFGHGTALMAQPFDTGSLELTGGAFSIVEQIQLDAAYSNAIFSASTNGVLVYQSGIPVSRLQLAWRNRDGTEEVTVGERSLYFAPELSPDGTLAAVVRDGVSIAQADIWLYDLTRGNQTRFTFDPGNDVAPMWSPDGKYLMYASDRNGPFDLYRKALTGVGEEELVYAAEVDNFPTGWSADGSQVLYEARPAMRGRGTQLKSDLWLLSLGENQQSSEFIVTSFDEAYAVFSPDGRWVAYQSNESGRNEVYVTPFPGRGRKWQISLDGGVQPLWGQDGNELYYISADSKLVAVEVQPGELTFKIGRATPLFDLRSSEGGIPYDVSADGKRFLVIKDVESDPSSLSLVVNWTAGLEEL